MLIMLSAEAAAAFDELTRSGRDSMLRQQDADAWPNDSRASRLVPAVEYLQASRIRRLLQEDMTTRLRGIDAYVSPSFEGGNILITNLTGHPCVAVPDGFLDAVGQTASGRVRARSRPTAVGLRAEPKKRPHSEVAAELDLHSVGTAGFDREAASRASGGRI
jgi:hypothetical protein